MSRIIVCSSEKSSGVKMSSPAVSSIRKLPPRLDVVTSLAISNPLENSGSSHTAADAHRDHTVTGSASLHFVQQRCCQFRSRAAQRISQSHRSAVDVHFRCIEPQLSNHSERLDRERFVQFDEVYILQLQPRKFEDFR